MDKNAAIDGCSRGALGQPYLLYAGTVLSGPQDCMHVVQRASGFTLLSLCTGRCYRFVSGGEFLNNMGPDSQLTVMWRGSCLPGAFVGRLARVLCGVVVSNQCRHHNWRDLSTANEGVDVDECESRWKLCRDCYVVLKNLTA